MSGHAVTPAEQLARSGMSLGAAVLWFWTYVVASALIAALAGEVVARTVGSAIPHVVTRSVVTATLVVAAGVLCEKALMLFAERAIS